MSFRRCLCTHVPRRFQGGMAIQRDALSTSTPPKMVCMVKRQIPHNSTVLIRQEWRKPAILLPPPPARPCPKESKVARLGAWYFDTLAHTAATHREGTGDPRRDSASGRIRPEVSPKGKQGKVRPPGFFAKGGRSPRANWRKTTHAHTPTPGQQF